MSLSDNASNPQTTFQIPLQYRQVLECLPMPVRVFDREGFIASFNEPAVQLWGRRPEVGKEKWSGSWKLYHLDGTPLAAKDTPLARTLEEGRSVPGFDMILERPDGERFHVLPHPQPMHDAQGRMIG